MKEYCQSLAEEYYTLIGKKDDEGIKRYLHQDVEFYGPMATLKGRDAVVTATRNFIQTFSTLTIQAGFGAVNEAIVVYTVDIPGIVKDFPGASWVQFQDGLIVRIQLFYDASRVSEKRESIFSKS